VKRTLFLLVAFALLLPACGDTDRPEGVVERWLISLNQGKAGEPGKYAPDELSQRILPNWQRRDPGDLDVIEVGRGDTASSPEHRLPPGRRYLVPYRVTRLDGQEMKGVVELVSPHAEPWLVEELLPADPRLRVPSQGGRRIGGASIAVWLAGLGIAGLLILAAAALMSTVGRQARVSG
jgi:hypothetical protein